MTEPVERTVVLFLGLPYTGKTALITRLLERLPGLAVYVDGIFRDIVSEEEICLDRWLAEGTAFVDRMESAVRESRYRVVYIELGIMQRVHRTALLRRLEAEGYRVIPLLLVCRSSEELARRQLARQQALDKRPDRLKIAIGLDELFGRIYQVFEPPDESEPFIPVDTSGTIDGSVETILELLHGAHESRRRTGP